MKYEQNYVEELYLSVGEKIKSQRGDVQRGQGKILSILYNNEGALLQDTIKKKMNIKAGSVSEMIGKLQKKGYVTKTSDQNDKRKVLILITDNGRMHVENYRKGSKKTFKSNSIFECLSEEELEQLAKILEKL